NHIDSIRETYTKNFTSKNVTKKQIAVATYLIDKLAVRAGNEKVQLDLSFGSVREQDRASDKCHKEKRKTVNGEVLLWAMSALGFEDYLEPLKIYLARWFFLECLHCPCRGCEAK
ncbi:unnamed protein product, partial [Eruca vesicaria subsp. sativa]|nr:unnamed protein product [Eruca vesicaria subsp. sativa]